ncbi:MAG: hypothetical protein J6Q61_02780 [Bacteroidales bacterium]|nr:hypothetical protein [Bacteroidales bacterium]MBO5853642.1 hypothetical protein [Bacteroidales bacterium]
MAATTFQTKIQVCNLALNLIGANEIEAFTDESREAHLLNANYELWVNQCFSKYPWRFATTAAQCTQQAVCPIPQWKYAYLMPADLVSIDSVYLNRVNPVYDTSTNPPTIIRYENAMVGDRLHWKDYSLYAGNILCTNVQDGVWVQYRKRVRESLWSASFINYVAYYIAIQLCPMIGRQFDLQKQLIAYTYAAGANSVYTVACTDDIQQYVPQQFDDNLLGVARELY